MLPYTPREGQQVLHVLATDLDLEAWIWNGLDRLEKYLASLALFHELYGR